MASTGQILGLGAANALGGFRQRRQLDNAVQGAAQLFAQLGPQGQQFAQILQQDPVQARNVIKAFGFQSLPQFYQLIQQQGQQQAAQQQQQFANEQTRERTGFQERRVHVLEGNAAAETELARNQLLATNRAFDALNDPAVTDQQALQILTRAGVNNAVSLVKARGGVGTGGDFELGSADVENIADVLQDVEPSERQRVAGLFSELLPPESAQRNLVTGLGQQGTFQTAAGDVQTKTLKIGDATVEAVQQPDGNFVPASLILPDGKKTPIVSVKSGGFGMAFTTKDGQTFVVGKNAGSQSQGLQAQRQILDRETLRSSLNIGVKQAGRFIELIEADPRAVGTLAGINKTFTIVRSTLQGLTSAESLQEAVAKVRRRPAGDDPAATYDAVNAVERGLLTFSPERAEATFLGDAMSYTQAIINNPDKRISDADLQAARDQLQVRGDPESVKVGIQSFQQQLSDRAQELDREIDIIQRLSKGQDVEVSAFTQTLLDDLGVPISELGSTATGSAAEDFTSLSDAELEAIIQGDA